MVNTLTPDVKKAPNVTHSTFARMDGPIGPLYPVVDDVAWIRRLLAAGVKTVQLRIKDPAHPALREQIEEAIHLGRTCRAQVFINDYWQLALDLGTYGIHLGQDDLKDADLAAIANAGIRLGVSTRTAEELAGALDIAPSYIAIGHIYPTPTKDMPTPPQGIDQLKKHLATVGGRFPTVAIGGIDLKRAPDVWQTGVSAVAVVRAVTQSADLNRTLEAFSDVFKARR